MDGLLQLPKNSNTDKRSTNRSKPWYAPAIPKNSREYVSVSLTDYKNFDLIDIRIYEENRKTLDFVWTKKGVSIRIDRITELIASLEELRNEAKRRGLPTECEDRSLVS